MISFPLERKNCIKQTKVVLLFLFCRVSFGQIIWFLSFSFYSCKMRTLGKSLGSFLDLKFSVYTIVRWGNKHRKVKRLAGFKQWIHNKISISDFLVNLFIDTSAQPLCLLLKLWRLLSLLKIQQCRKIMLQI